MSGYGGCRPADGIHGGGHSRRADVVGDRRGPRFRESASSPRWGLVQVANSYSDGRIRRKVHETPGTVGNVKVQVQLVRGNELCEINWRKVGLRSDPGVGQVQGRVVYINVHLLKVQRVNLRNSDAGPRPSYRIGATAPQGVG